MSSQHLSLLLACQVYQRISSFVSASEWYFEHGFDHHHSPAGTQHEDHSAHNGAHTGAVDVVCLGSV